jgi:hypothetical protein
MGHPDFSIGEKWAIRLRSTLRQSRGECSTWNICLTYVYVPLYTYTVINMNNGNGL